MKVWHSLILINWDCLKITLPEINDQRKVAGISLNEKIQQLFSMCLVWSFCVLRQPLLNYKFYCRLSGNGCGNICPEVCNCNSICIYEFIVSIRLGYSSAVLHYTRHNGLTHNPQRSRLYLFYQIVLSPGAQRKPSGFWS